MGRVSSGQPLEFLSTHPAHETRLEALGAGDGRGDHAPRGGHARGAPSTMHAMKNPAGLRYLTRPSCKP